MTDKEVKARISLEDALTPAMEKVQESLKGFHGSIVSLDSALNLFKTAGEAVNKVYTFTAEVFTKAFHEALEGEKATNRLRGALIQTGNYTTTLNHQLNENAEALEKLVGANGETVKSMIATGLQMGLNVQQAQEMERAARQLAAANGIEVQEAFSALNASLMGNSRALGKLIPQVKELGSAQLKQGEAIKIVNEATTAAYGIYQASLPAAVERANVAFDNIYKAIGSAITQSPVLKTAINAAADAFNRITALIEENREEITQWINAGIIQAAKAIPLLVTAFGVLDETIVSITNVFRMAIAGFTIAIEAVVNLASKLPNSMFKTLGIDIEGAKTSLDSFKNAMFENIMASQQSLETRKKGLEAIRTVVQDYANTVEASGNISAEAHKKSTGAAEQEFVAQSNINKVVKERGALYAGIDIGTAKQREALQAQVQDRDGDLKDFQAYLTAKQRLAIDAQVEETMEVNKVRAEALKGAGGATEGGAAAQVELDAETKKQASLKAIRDQGIITEQEYHDAKLANQQRMEEISFQMANAHAIAKADALGESEAGFMAKQALDEQHFQLELQQKLARAEMEGATDMEIMALKESLNQEHLARVKEQKEEFLNRDIEQNERLGNQWAVTLGKIRLEQEKHGVVLGTIRGVQQSQEFKAVTQSLTDLSSLRNGHSKKAFEVGKAAAIAQATINTFLAATAAFSAMASIPYVGPALGAAAAAAAIAAGIINVQNIAAQKFNPGGQADEGMDSIPQSLSGKSFVLSGGERVVQPSANKDLTSFLNNAKGTTVGPSYSITLHYNGSGGEQDARRMADIVIKEIRAASERGMPVISSKGII